MHTTLTCPDCRQVLQVPTEHLGKRVQCPACKATFPTEPVLEAITEEEPPLRPVREPEARPRKRRVSAEAEAFAAEIVAKVERDERLKGSDHGMPGYLTILAVLPWGIAVLTCGGCIPIVIAAGLSSTGFAIAASHRTPVPLRLVALILLNLFGYVGTLVLILVLAFAVRNAGR